MQNNKTNKNQIDRGFDPYLWQSRLAGTNINPETLLATDYLNHFNEVTMLMDIVGDLPDCLDDILNWQPKSYPDHFQTSSFPYKSLAVEAYEAAPAAGRQALDQVVTKLNSIVLSTVAALAANDMKTRPQDMAQIASGAAAQLRHLIGLAGSIINGAPIEENGTFSDQAPAPQSMDQSDIDSLFG